jgi:hypothetical protein
MTARAMGCCALPGTHRSIGRSIRILVIAERPAASLGRPTLTQCGKKHASFLTHNSFTRNFFTRPFYTQLSHTQLFHTQPARTHTQFFHAHNFLKSPILHHLLCLFFSVRSTASTTVCNYCKKLTCGAIPSLKCVMFVM